MASDVPTLEEFADYTTMHGFHFIITGGFIFRRIVWGGLLFCMLCAAVILFVAALAKLNAHETLVIRELQHSKNLKFPAFSICNLNMMKKSKLLGTDAQIYLDQLDVSYFFTKGRSENLSASFDIEKAVEDNGHKFSDMVLVCFWGGRRCRKDDFTTFMSPKYGLCYMFNSGKEGHPIHSSNSVGHSSGLFLYLHIEPEEYYGPMSYISTGIRFLVHDQNGIPMMEKYGQNAMPGFSTDIRFTRKKIVRLPAPFKSMCREKTSQKYSRSACLGECYARITMERCGCRLLSMPATGKFKGTKYCSPTQAKACGISPDPVNVTKYKDLSSYLMNAENNYFVVVGNSLKLLPTMCDCPLECDHIEYPVTLSTSYFPSPSLNAVLIMTNNNSNSTMTSNSLRQSVVILNVFYEDLSTDVQIEKPAYGWFEFCASTGGNVGLLLGCSVLTIFEFIDFIIVVCLKRFNRQISQQPNQYMGNSDAAIETTSPKQGGVRETTTPPLPP